MKQHVSNRAPPEAPEQSSDQRLVEKWTRRGHLEVEAWSGVRAGHREDEAGLSQGSVSTRAGQMLPQERELLSGQKNAWKENTSYKSSGHGVTREGGGTGELANA